MASIPDQLARCRDTIGTEGATSWPIAFRPASQDQVQPAIASQGHGGG